MKSSVAGDRTGQQELSHGEIATDAGERHGVLVDVRKQPLRFDILRHSPRGYVASRKQDGWIKSTVFGRAFLLETEKDRLGNAQYFLRVK